MRKETEDIIEKLKQVEEKEVCVHSSFGRKSAYLAWCAIHAGKKVTMRFIRAKSRIFPDMLVWFDRAQAEWEKLGAVFEIVDIVCETTDPKVMPCFDKIKEAYEGTGIMYLSITTASHASRNKRLYDKDKEARNMTMPFVGLSERDVSLYATEEVPKELYVNLASLDSPHYCANPICPWWENSRPSSLERYKRWRARK